MSRWGDLNNIITRTISGVLSNGWRRTLKQVYTIHDPKIGTLIGQDHLGNQYYENRNEAWGRHRWVEYERWSWPGEADRVPAEWHGWLSKSHDDPAHALKKAKYQTPHEPNYTGSRAAYKPYNTTMPKTSSWTPSVRERGV